MRVIIASFALLGFASVHAFGVEKPETLFSVSSTLFTVSPDQTGEVASFSKKAFFDPGAAEPVRFGKPVQFVADNIKIWTFEGDGDRVTMYTVGIAGEFKTPVVGAHVLFRMGTLSYRGSVGNAGVGSSAIKGVDELPLEPGQSYVIFQLKEREEAIAVAHALAALLK